jgi:CheY-like chemotaxis protein
LDGEECECGVSEGQLHVFGRRWEFCPFCEVQMVECDCLSLHRREVSRVCGALGRHLKFVRRGRGDPAVEGQGKTMDVTSQPGTRCVLVVEDHRDSCKALARLLSGLGYTVVTALSVADARAALRRHRFDLLVADIGLPDGSGLELVGELRQAHPVAKAVVLSGYTSDADAAASAAAGSTAFLPKPVMFTEFQATVERLLGGEGSPAQPAPPAEFGPGDPGTGRTAGA